jgi:hypothetical protein
VCSVLVVSLKTAMEKSGYNARNILDWCEHCVLVWRKMLFVSLVRDPRCFVLSFIICSCNSFKFCRPNCLLCFLFQLSTSPN